MLTDNRIEAVRGTRVGGEHVAHCAICGGLLYDDVPVPGYAYRVCDASSLSIARLYCSPGDRRGIEHATFGAHEVLFASRLERDANTSVLADVAILEQGPPTEPAAARAPSLD